MASRHRRTFTRSAVFNRRSRCSDIRIAVDGDYGSETRQAVTSFQMHAGIVADGVAGAQTEAKLLAELKPLGQFLR